MKTKQIQQVLNTMTNFIGRNTTLPILEKIYINWNGEYLIFRWTDMEKYIQVKLPSNIKWWWCIDFAKFKSFISLIEEETFELIFGKELTIKSGKDNIKLKIETTDNYLSLPQVHWDATKIDGIKILEGITKCQFAINKKWFSLVLTWLLIRWGDNTCFVWTNSLCLAEYKIDTITPAWDTIIPKANLKAISEVLKYINWDVVFNKSDNLLSIKWFADWCEIECTTLLIQGKYPEYDNHNIMPKEFNTTITINKSEISKTINKINILTKDRNNYVKVMACNDVKFTTEETDFWDIDIISSAVKTGQDVNFWFNGKHILDLLPQIASDTITIDIVNGEKPVTIKEWNFTYIFRPIQC